MAYCHRCGAKLTDDSRYCWNCGVSQDLEEEPKSTGESAFAGHTGLNALIGGTVAFVLGTVFAAIFAPAYLTGIVIGGGVAGYLQAPGSPGGPWVGAISGLLATVPIVLLVFAGAVFGIFWTLFHVPGVDLPVGVGIVWLGIFVLFGISLIANVVFGALGGLVGAALARDE